MSAVAVAVALLEQISTSPSYINVNKLCRLLKYFCLDLNQKLKFLYLVCEMNYILPELNKKIAHTGKFYGKIYTGLKPFKR